MQAWPVWGRPRGVLHTRQSPSGAVGVSVGGGGTADMWLPWTPSWPSCLKSHQLPLAMFFIRKLSRVAVLSPHHNSFS